jgi:hypothetical protein
MHRMTHHTLAQGLRHGGLLTDPKHGIAVQSAQQRLQQICLLTGQTLTQWACPKGAAYGIF